jgi:hypothetical protein
MAGMCSLRLCLTPGACILMCTARKSSPRSSKVWRSLRAGVPLWKVSSAPPRRRTKPGPQGPGFILWPARHCERRQTRVPGAAQLFRNTSPLRGRSIREADREGGSFLFDLFVRAYSTSLGPPSLTLPLKGGGKSKRCILHCARDSSIRLEALSLNHGFGGGLKKKIDHRAAAVGRWRGARHECGELRYALQRRR